MRTSSKLLQVELVMVQVKMYVPAIAPLKTASKACEFGEKLPPEGPEYVHVPVNLPGSFPAN